MKRKIAIASDHAAYNLKKSVLNFLNDRYSQVYEILDFGCECSNISVNYPDYAKKVSEFVSMSKHNFGILICGTGIGMCITANKFKGIRASLCTDTYSAKMAKLHNNSNILCFGSRVLGDELTNEIVSTWLDFSYEGGRHNDRLDLIKKIEEEN